MLVLSIMNTNAVCILQEKTSRPTDLLIFKQVKLVFTISVHGRVAWTIYTNFHSSSPLSLHLELWIDLPRRFWEIENGGRTEDRASIFYELPL